MLDKTGQAKMLDMKRMLFELVFTKKPQKCLFLTSRFAVTKDYHPLNTL